MTPDRVVLVDVSYVCHRAGHAMRDMDVRVAAIRCLLPWLQVLRQGNTDLVFCYDGKDAKEARRELVPDYKTGRTHPFDIAPAEALIKKLPGSHVLEDRSEADDAIAWLAQGFERAGTPTFILTDDTDTWPLISKLVHVWSPARGMIGLNHAMLKYGLNSFKTIPVFKAICGEPGDTVPPACPRIRKKNVQRMLNALGPTMLSEFYARLAAHSEEDPYLTERLDVPEVRLSLARNLRVITPRVERFTPSCVRHSVSGVYAWEGLRDACAELETVVGGLEAADRLRQFFPNDRPPTKGT